MPGLVSSHSAGISFNGAAAWVRIATGRKGTHSAKPTGNCLAFSSSLATACHKTGAPNHVERNMQTVAFVVLEQQDACQKVDAAFGNSCEVGLHIGQRAVFQQRGIMALHHRVQVTGYIKTDSRARTIVTMQHEPG